MVDMIRNNPFLRYIHMDNQVGMNRKGLGQDIELILVDLVGVLQHNLVFEFPWCMMVVDMTDMVPVHKEVVV